LDPQTMPRVFESVATFAPSPMAQKLPKVTRPK
jgi:hypothetical protein